MDGWIGGCNYFTCLYDIFILAGPGGIPPPPPPPPPPPSPALSAAPVIINNFVHN